MINIDNSKVRENLLSGYIGLEKESLRIDSEGFFVQTPHPFQADDPNIVRDFCENQTEINTSVCASVEEAMEQLKFHTLRIQETLSELKEPEYLWPFSNPPYIKKEKDIPIARYEGAEIEKQDYRNYLSDRYGRYKMTFSGIHFNYSFDESVVGADKDAFYVSLAAKAQAYNWLIVAATAASPLLDSSYVEKGVYGRDIFNGMGSTRCSELGYWNMFTPILDYTDIEHYVDSIVQYVDMGLIHSSAELYYPVRLKPAGKYDLHSLKKNGVSHIELRMIDLNPLTPWGIDERDVYFIKYLLSYLAVMPDINADAREQVFAIQNTKNAAHYDLKTVNVIMPDHRTLWVADAAIEVLNDMKKFYRDIYNDKSTGKVANSTDIEKLIAANSGNVSDDTYEKINEILDYQIAKFENAENRYAWKIRERFYDGFVEKGLKLCKDRNTKDNNELKAS